MSSGSLDRAANKQAMSPHDRLCEAAHYLLAQLQRFDDSVDLFLLHKLLQPLVFNSSETPEQNTRCIGMTTVTPFRNLN